MFPRSDVGAQHAAPQLARAKKIKLSFDFVALSRASFADAASLDLARRQG
jgi:hypothetical protein